MSLKDSGVFLFPVLFNFVFNGILIDSHGNQKLRHQVFKALSEGKKDLAGGIASVT